MKAWPVAILTRPAAVGCCATAGAAASNTAMTPIEMRGLITAPSGSGFRTRTYASVISGRAARGHFLPVFTSYYLDSKGRAEATHEGLRAEGAVSAAAA